jgi:hypothetical protein
MVREIKVGTISWINDTPNPMRYAIEAKILDPEWIPKTYLGLAATANQKPPPWVGDFPAYQRSKDFRAMTYCRFRIETDDQSSEITRFEVLEAFHDGGWTPPFRLVYGTTALYPGLWGALLSNSWYQGEFSPLSRVYTESRHPNTALAGKGNGEVVLANSLIKFRAGSHTDDVGVNDVKCPYHVPWVWCEMLLTYSNGMLNMYGTGSIFPSHAWYLDGNLIETRAQVGDSIFPTVTIMAPPSFIPGPPGSPRIVIPTNRIDVTALKIYPVLSAGVPVDPENAPVPQWSLDQENSCSGTVISHQYTVAGQDIWSRRL